MSTETLFYGGTILPMTGETNRLEALLVRGGRIAFAGALDEARALAGPETEEVDLAGRALMPSFIDPHGHLPLVAQFAAFADLSGCTNFAQIAATLTAYREAKGLGPEDVLMGVNYDNNFLDEQAHPDKRLLDQVSTEIPIFIFHTSSHMGCCNSRLLELVGYTADTPDPQGGRIGRLSGSREPSGYLEEASAFGPAIMQLFSRVKVDMPAQLAAAQQEYLSRGVTTVQDGASNPETVGMLASFAAAGALLVDVVSYPMAEPEIAEKLRPFAAHLGQYSGHLKVGGLKTVLDGSPQGRTAWLSRPYEGGEDCAYGYLKDDALLAICRQAVEGGWQLLAHCNGDAASEQFLNQYEAALAEHPERRDLRPVMIHCQTVRDDQLDRMAQIGMIPSIFVGHTWYWGDVHLKNLGPERGARISPVRSALERGLIYNFHQDPPVTKPDMLHSVWCAVNRTTRTGQPIGPEQAIGVYDALRAVTVNAAYEYFEEDRKGTLEVGKLADLVVLDADPLAVELDAIRDIRVLATYKEGVCRYGGV